MLGGMHHPLADLVSSHVAINYANMSTWNHNGLSVWMFLECLYDWARNHIHYLNIGPGTEIACGNHFNTS